MTNEQHSFAEWLKRLGIKFTSRKFLAFLGSLGLVIFVGYAGGWNLAVDLGKIVVPVAITAFVGSVAYEKGHIKTGAA